MEYWITSDGDHIYCDGDAGVEVPNHAMVVVSHCAGLLIDALEEEGSELSDCVVAVIRRHLEDVVDCVALRTEINDSIDDWVDAGYLTPDEADDIFEALAKRAKIDYEYITTAIGQHDDPREIGLKLGWIRVINYEFSIQKFDRDTAERILDFVFEQDVPNSQTFALEVEDFGGHRIYINGLTTNDLDYRSLRKHLSIARRTVEAG